ncbi:MAG: ABC transporter substrate-binding protein [Sulfuricella denitrificans]|nr:ABC transporter substrate-binding protein [Sulfuricella denitrificans]
MMFRIRALLMACALLAGFAAGASELAPDTLVKNTAQEVLAIIKQDKDIQSGNSQKVLDLVEAKVLPHFAFARMAQLAVGRHWPKASPAQQQALIQEFRTLLVRTYSGSLTSYKDQTIDYRPAKLAPGDTDVTVKTVVNQPGGQPIPIEYSLEKGADGWKVYDVAVDGVSLVTNYRSSFSSEIQRHGIDGLIKTLTDKNRKEAASNLKAVTARKK